MARKCLRDLTCDAQHPNYPKPKTEICGQSEKTIDNAYARTSEWVLASQRKRTVNRKNPSTTKAARDVQSRMHEILYEMLRA